MLNESQLARLHAAMGTILHPTIPGALSDGTMVTVENPDFYHTLCGIMSAYCMLIPTLMDAATLLEQEEALQVLEKFAEEAACALS